MGTSWVHPGWWAGRTSVAMSNRQVLVVEDERSDRRRGRGAAAGRRASTSRTAGDGPAAVAPSRGWQPDLVVLDIMLPGFDGLEVCRRIQADRPVPVHHADRPRRRDRPAGRARGRCRRLPDQAVLAARTGGPRARGAAPRSSDRPNSATEATPAGAADRRRRSGDQPDRAPGPPGRRRGPSHADRVRPAAPPRQPSAGGAAPRAAAGPGLGLGRRIGDAHGRQSRQGVCAASWAPT